MAKRTYSIERKVAGEWIAVGNWVTFGVPAGNNSYYGCPPVLVKELKRRFAKDTEATEIRAIWKSKEIGRIASDGRGTGCQELDTDYCTKYPHHCR